LKVDGGHNFGWKANVLADFGDDGASSVIVDTCKSKVINLSSYQNDKTIMSHLMDILFVRGVVETDVV
jgi:hypothetical protein